VTKPDIKPEKSKEAEDDEEPLKVEFTPVTEEGAIYSKRYIPVAFCICQACLAVHITAFYPLRSAVTNVIHTISDVKSL
jgi:hypothetical protein